MESGRRRERGAGAPPSDEVAVLENSSHLAGAVKRAGGVSAYAAAGGPPSRRVSLPRLTDVYTVLLPRLIVSIDLAASCELQINNKLMIENTLKITKLC